MAGWGGRRKVGTIRMASMTTKNRKAHMGTGLRQKLGFFSSIGVGNDKENYESSGPRILLKEIPRLKTC